MNIDFSEIFYEMLLKNLRRRKRKKFSLEDIKEIEPEIFKSLKNLKKNNQ